MSVINQLRNGKAISTLDFQLDRDKLVLWYDVLRHSDGSVYVVFSEAGADYEAYLWGAVSTDMGRTFSTPVQITSGNYDCYPTLVQIDLLDTDSEIGIVFTRATGANQSGNLTRVQVDKNFGIQSPLDPVFADGGSSPITTNHPPCLVNNGSAFILMRLSSDQFSSTPVMLRNGTSFTANNWQTVSQTQIVSVGSELLAMRMRLLANGHLCLVVAHRTSLNGNVNAPARLGENIRSDISICFSSDSGNTWSSAQKLTDYTGVPRISETGIDSAFYPEVVQLSDGSIVVIFQEGRIHMAVSSSTSNPAIPTGSFFHNDFAYSESRNTLYATGRNFGADPAGLIVTDLDAQTSILISNTSVPDIFNKEAQCLALSEDERWLAVGTNVGGITLFDLNSSPSIAGVSFYQFRTTSLVALRANNIACMLFKGNKLFFGYGTVGVSDVGGGVIDAVTRSSVVDLTVAGAGNLIFDEVLETSESIVFKGSSTRLTAFDKNGVSGTHKYNLTTTNLATGPRTMVWDGVNEEFLVQAQNAIRRYEDTGSSITLEGSVSVPSISGLSSFPGIGAWVHGTNTGTPPIGFYSFATRQMEGFISSNRQRWGYTPIISPNNAPISHVNSGGMIVSGGISSMVILPTANRGRLRYAYCTYDPLTLSVTAEDFYDVVNVNRIAAYDKLIAPRGVALQDDSIFTLTTRLDLEGGSTRPLRFGIGIIEPDTYKLNCRAKIRNTYIRELGTRAKIRNTSTQTLESKALIAFAQCFTAKAKIVPVSSQSISSQAAIVNWKESIHDMVFSVSKIKEASFTGVFNVRSGNVKSRPLRARAFILGNYESQFVGHFIVAAEEPSSEYLVVASQKNTLQTLRMGAIIVQP